MNMEELKRNIEVWGDSSGYYAQVDVDEETFIILNDDWPCLNKFYYNEDEPFMEEDMIFSKESGELDEEEKELCEMLAEAMHEAFGISVEKWWEE